jgi:CxxC-x17-CxxC domain-containing protein
MADRTIVCVDCGQPFVFNEREQEFYAERNFTEPKRDKACRDARKAAREGDSDGYSAGGYSSGSRGSYGDDARTYGGPRGYSSGGSDRPVREMFSATCASCGKEARVPFQPRQDRPVYCSDCFNQQGGARR